MVSSLSLKPSLLASRPTEIAISGATGPQSLVRVPLKGGVIHFTPLMTNTLKIAFVGVAARVSLTPSFGVEFPVPVGISQISVPGLVSSVAPPASKEFFVPCGQGPTLQLDGTSVPTAVIGTAGDLLNFKPVQFIGCLPTSGFSLSAGTHNFAISQGTSAFEVSSVVIKSASAAHAQPAHRSATITQWSADSRAVKITRGPATDIAIAQNYNIGWHATLGTTALTPIRIDGWQQGFRVPAGRGGTISIVMSPDTIFRLALLFGAMFLVLLGALALWPARRPEATPEPCPTRDRLSFVAIFVGSMIILFIVAGPLSLVALPLFAVARKWGNRWTAATAFVAFIVVGIAAALDPATVNSPGAGAFGPTAQVASIVAFAAVLASLGFAGLRPKATAESPPDDLRLTP